MIDDPDRWIDGRTDRPPYQRKESTPRLEKSYTNVILSFCQRILGVVISRRSERRRWQTTGDCGKQNPNSGQSARRQVEEVRPKLHPLHQTQRDQKAERLGE